MSDAEPKTPSNGTAPATGAAWTDTERVSSPPQYPTLLTLVDGIPHRDRRTRPRRAYRVQDFCTHPSLIVPPLPFCRSPAILANTPQQAPIPGGRNVNACRKIVKKLKDKLRDSIEDIKAGRPVIAPAEGEVPAKATPKKRKTEGSEVEESPKKKATPRKKKSDAIVKDEEEGDIEL